jgi:transposase
MLKVGHIVDIKTLHQQGYSIRAVAEATGFARNTARKALRGQHPLKRQATPRLGKLDPFHDCLRQRCAEHPLSAVRLLAEIRPMGHAGSVDTLRRFLASLRQRQHARRKLTVRFETPPGEQAQADWSYCGRLLGHTGQPASVYAFALVLSYSRMLFVRFTTSMKMADLIACHQSAFAYLGGWPRVILFDNMKQVKLGPGRFNEQFLDFANHHGFSPKTHRPYRPRTKGRVERVIDHLKGNFLLGRSFTGLDDLNAQARLWLERVANVRLHATTGRRPIDLFEQEKGPLTPVASVPPYRHLDPVERTVNWEAMVHYQGSRYSVPPCHAGQKVQVAASGGLIVVRLGDAVLAEHRQAARAGQCIVDKNHLEELWKVAKEHIEPAQEVRWRAAEPEVARAPLSAFEEGLPRACPLRSWPAAG